MNLPVGGSSTYSGAMIIAEEEGGAQGQRVDLRALGLLLDCQLLPVTLAGRELRGCALASSADRRWPPASSCVAAVAALFID